MERIILTPQGVWDSSPYRFSQAIRVRNFQEVLFIAGQVGMDEQGRIPEGVEAQIRQAFQNIHRIVTSAGGSMQNVVKLNGYFRDLSALDPYTEVLGELFPKGGFPAATVVEVQSLALEPLLVEIEAIAVL